MAEFNNCSPKQKAIELVDKYKNIRLDILTKMDSIPCVLSDYPTILTAKILAGYEVMGILDTMQKDSGTKRFWVNVSEEIGDLYPQRT